MITLARPRRASAIAAQPTATFRPAGTQISATGYDDNGNVATQTDPLSHATGYLYDAQDRLSSVTDALGRVTGYGYDGAGRPTTITAPGTPGGTQTTTNHYDSAGWRTGIDYSDPAPTAPAPPSPTTAPPD